MAKKKKKPPSNVFEAKNELTHEHIRNAYIELIRDPKRTGRVPSIKELATHTGLHRNTVSAHLKKYTLSENMYKFAILTEDVVMAMFKTAMGGNVNAQAKFLELFNVKFGNNISNNQPENNPENKDYFDMGDGNKIIF